MTSELAVAGKRDFVGYGMKPPRVKWPQGARLALTIAVNYEAGGERSVVSGDSGPETYGEFASYGTPPKRDLGIESVFEYETRAAIWRLLDLFDRFGVKVTFFATARTLEANRGAAREIVKRGHEVCSHGFRWVEHYTLTKEEERRAISDAVKSITESTGRRPLGWYCREPSENTIELISEEGGFLYDSDVYNDDLPYFVKCRQGRRLLLIPYTPDVNDFHYFSNRFANSDEFYGYLKDSFDVLYEEGAKHPKLMNLGIHVRISGRPGRTKAVERFLRYVSKKEGVWIGRRVDVANWWIKKYG
ncbi:MAG TPA: polysaccharide deacetylase family protein [Nitrososphaerales archaeon]|nr:polysaccharide deacetylase family protein [Nitrososphaerales archaeon]